MNHQIDENCKVIIQKGEEFKAQYQLSLSSLNKKTNKYH